MSDAIKVTPLDIQQKRFHIGFRGYERTEVELFLDLVRDEMESLVREVADLREFRQAYDQRLKELAEKEENVKNTMLMTQKLIEELKVGARKEADLIVKDAGIRSEQTVGNAQQEKFKLESDIQELRRRKHQFLQDMKKIMQMHLEMVNFEEAGSGAKEEPAPE
ncbi:MAG: DivIVA domain-containing protein [Nitrospiraceae bacterium]|nr:DivIVA domain-containing protein [Nitrospiraceae bacterium]